MSMKGVKWSKKVQKLMNVVYEQLLSKFIYIIFKKQVSYIATKSSFILFVAMHTVMLCSYLVVLPRELHLHESQQKTLGPYINYVVLVGGGG